MINFFCRMSILTQIWIISYLSHLDIFLIFKNNFQSELLYMNILNRHILIKEYKWNKHVIKQTALFSNLLIYGTES